MDRIDDLAAFVAIVERGSQTVAARHLRRSLQSINRSLAALERSVGVKLINRTTRRSNPTATGLGFYRRIKPALGEIAEARLEAISRRAEPSGLLRIGAPVLFAPAYVAPVVSKFLKRYPQIEIELKVSDRQVDLLTEALDLAVRIRNLPDSELKARPLGALRVVAYGAPAYFAKHGRPKHPHELTGHQCILRSAEPNAERWSFRIGGRHRRVRVDGRFRTDSAAVAHSAVAAGLGIGLAPLWQIRPLVDDGSVQVILQDFEMPKLPIHAVWLPTKMPLPGTKLFTEFLAASLKMERF